MKRKNVVKDIAESAGMGLVLAGLIVCMCETDLDKQLFTLGIGFGMIFFGAVVSILANRGEKDELPG